MVKATPARTAKAAGLKSMKRMIELTGVPRKTLEDWFYSRRDRFDALLKLCAYYDVSDQEGI